MAVLLLSLIVLCSTPLCFHSLMQLIYTDCLYNCVDEQALLEYNILFYLYSQQGPNFLESRLCLRD